MKTINNTLKKIFFTLLGVLLFSCMITLPSHAATKCIHDFKQIHILRTYPEDCANHRYYFIEWKCTKCGQIDTSEEIDENHPPLGHKFVNCVCTVCGEEHSFTKPTELKEHYPAWCGHKSSDVYYSVCEFCGKEDSDGYFYRSTVTIRNENEPLIQHNFVNDKCTLCEQEHDFTVKTKLLVHYGPSIIHYGFNRYSLSCKYCGLESEWESVDVINKNEPPTIIDPDTLTVPTIKSIKNKSKGKIVLSWKKAVNASGYEIQYSKYKNFKKPSKKSVSKSKLTYTINKLTKKKTYYVRVRAYKNLKHKKIYSTWSPAKKIKIKK